MNLNVMTWNIAGDYDYSILLTRADMEVPKTNEEIQKTRHALFQRIFHNLMKTQHPDILCLQETGSGDHVVKDLRCKVGRNYYQAAHDGADSAVMWNTKSYELVENSTVTKSKGQRFYTIVDLKHLETGKVVRVASTHLSGCHPKNPQKTSPMETDATPGNQELEELLETMTKRKGADVFVVGLDANVVSTHPRLEILRSIGFVSDKSDEEVTCYNPFQKENMKIDYIFTRTIKDKYVPEITSPKETHEKPKLENPKTNPSDHTFVVKSIQVPELSTWRRRMTSAISMFQKK